MLRWYGVASAVPSGGIGLVTTPQAGIDVRLPWPHCVRNEFDQAEAILRAAFAADETNEATAAVLCGS